MVILSSARRIFFGISLLSDKTPILFHDDELDEREIETLNVDALTSITRVRDLAPFAGRTTMILEVKRSKWEDILCSEVSAWPNIVVASFDHTMIAELARRNVNFPLGITIFGAIVDVASYAASLNATWVFPGFRYVDRDMVETLHARDIKIAPWTVNRERDWERLHDIECDGIITDDPEAAVAWRGREA